MCCDARVQREPGHLADPGIERLLTRRQREDLAALLWPNGDAVRDRRTEELIQRPGLEAVAGQIAVLRVAL